MFRQMKNIDTAFRSFRIFTIIVITGCILLSCFSVYWSYHLVAKVQSRIYILVNGKALEAFAAERKDNIPVEAKDHISSFHQLFFSLDPDDKVIQSNISKALYLADASAKRQYESLKENGYYSSVIAGNISQEISIDSISLSMEQYPYFFRYYGKQRIIRPTSIVLRSLVTEGYLRNVSRSDNNSHGFLIERWTTIENKDINIQNR